ncbi:MAG: alpha/beta fold hydrolase [Myxococcota bacterium]
MALRLLCVVALFGVACGDDSSAPVDAQAEASLDAAPPVDQSVIDEGMMDAEVAVEVGADEGMDERVIAPGDPSVLGPRTLSETEDRVGDTPVVAYVPEGGGPLVVFAPGFLLESAFYESTMRHIASHGFVVVRTDPPMSFATPDHVAIRDDMRAVVDWSLRDAPFASQVDAGRIAAVGHSLGGKAATMLALADSRITALVAIDPVDGGGFIPSDRTPDIVPSDMDGLVIASAFLGETTNGSGGFMPCAPTDNNFQRFYEAATRATVAYEFDFLGADHMDFLSERSACGRLCGACDEGSADDAAVAAGTNTIVTAFLRLRFFVESGMTQWLDGASRPADVNVRSR